MTYREAGAVTACHKGERGAGLKNTVPSVDNLVDSLFATDYDRKLW